MAQTPLELPRKGSVLLLARDMQVERRIVRIAAAGGHKVVVASTGQHALHELEKRHYDLMLLDTLSFNMSWIEDMGTLRRKTKRSVVGIIADHAENPIASEMMLVSPLLLIRKPFKVAEIVKALNMAIELGH